MGRLKDENCGSLFIYTNLIKQIIKISAGTMLLVILRTCITTTKFPKVDVCPIRKTHTFSYKKPLYHNS